MLSRDAEPVGFQGWHEKGVLRAPIGIMVFGDTTVWYGMAWHGMAPIWYDIGSLPYHAIPWYCHIPLLYRNIRKQCLFFNVLS